MLTNDQTQLLDIGGLPNRLNFLSIGKIIAVGSSGCKKKKKQWCDTESSPCLTGGCTQNMDDNRWTFWNVLY